MAIPCRCAFDDYHDSFECQESQKSQKVKPQYWTSKDWLFVKIGYTISLAMLLASLLLTGNALAKERIAIKKEVVAERYDLSFISDAKGAPFLTKEDDESKDYVKFQKIQPRLYTGVANLYSHADKKFYKFSYVFDSLPFSYKKTWKLKTSHQTTS